MKLAGLRPVLKPAGLRSQGVSPTSQPHQPVSGLKERASPGVAAGGAGVDGGEAAGGALRAPPWDGVDGGEAAGGAGWVGPP